MIMDFITFINDSGNSNESHDDALKYGVGFVILTIFCGASYIHYFYTGSVYGMKVRVAISSLVYRKVSVNAFK